MCSDKNRILAIFFVALAMVFAASGAFAENYNEELYFKDYVTNNGINVVVAINKDTDEVELYWSETNQTWLKPTKEEQLGLQRLYNRKMQLQDMQDNLNRMRNSTWYTTNQDSHMTGGR